MTVIARSRHDHNEPVATDVTWSNGFAMNGSIRPFRVGGRRGRASIASREALIYQGS